MPTVLPGVVSALSDDSGILGCINDHDGSGFIHALLEAYHPAYSRIRSEHYRTHLAKSVRIGALPEILKQRYGTDSPLSSTRGSEAKSLFNRAVAYGSPIPSGILKDYAKYLRVPYRLHNASLELVESYDPPPTPMSRRRSVDIVPCHIIETTEDEYHLLVLLQPDTASSSRGGSKATRFRILDDKLQAVIEAAAE